MNRTSDVELVLRDYLADDGASAPDYVLDILEGRISRQRQRRSWRLRWRLHPMNRPLTLLAAAVAVMLIAVVGYNLLPRTASFGGPDPTATLAPTTGPSQAASIRPSATPYPCAEETTGCAGAIRSGAHASVHFRPAFTFTTDIAWLNTQDVANNYHLETGAADYLLLWSDVVISQHTATCAPVPQAGVGNTVKDWIDFVTSHPGLDATAPVDISLGDAHGQVVDLTVKDGWTKTCAGFPGTSVQFIMHPDRTHGTYGAASWVPLRLFVLDVGGETVLIEAYGRSPDLDTVVRSMVFTAGS